MVYGRLHASIPKAELDAFRSYCSEHEITMSRALTGLLHVFNVRVRRSSEQETERLRQRVEAQAHEAVQAYKRQAEQMVAEAGRELPLPSPPEAL